MTVIREGTADDLPRLRTIQEATLTEPWPELLETAVGGGPPLLLVVERRTVLGYALAIADGDRAYVAEFAVAPDQQGEGHGSRLMRALCSRLADAGHERVRLTVRVDDARAQSFYASHGFETVERVPDHYDDGRDGLLLERSLDEGD